MHSGWRDGEGVGGSRSSSPKLLDLHFILCVLLLFYSLVVNVLSTREFWSGQILRSEEGGGLRGGGEGEGLYCSSPFCSLSSLCPRRWDRKTTGANN